MPKSAKTPKAPKPKKPTKPSAPAPAGAAPATSAHTTAGTRVRIRMYRQGVGDCFLVSFPRQGGDDFNLVIDCGVHQAQAKGPEKIRDIVADLAAATKGKIDLLVLTHEHFDHTSGFVQAKELWQDKKKLHVSDLWYAWTEKPGAEFEKTPREKRHGIAETPGGTLRDKRHDIVETLRGVVARQSLAGAPSERAQRIESILGFFGDKAGAKTLEIRDAIDALCPKEHVHFMSPGDVEIFPGVDARFYVLGPPKDTDHIKKVDSPSETYGIARLDAVYAMVASLAPDAARPPFDKRYWLPLDTSRTVDFFQARYWEEKAPASAVQNAPPPAATAPPAAIEDTDQGWRRIDDDWLGPAEQLALQLDNATNNTSLVLAIEVPGGAPDKDNPVKGDVLLFAADAQVGNWLSWQDVRFAVDGKTVTGPNLLARTIFYKVGHHGSGNATLKQNGLELMARLDIAMMPTDAAMADKVKWGKLPLPELIKELRKRTGQRLIRSDEALPGALAGKAREGKDGLYYEIEY